MPQTDYTQVPLKFVNEGLNCAVPPDLVGKYEYTRLTNIRTLQDGQLASRFGLAKTDWGTDCGWIVYMARGAGGALIFILSEGNVFWNNTQVLVPNDALGVGNRIGTELDPNPENGTIPKTPLILENVEEISLVNYTNSYSGEDWTFFATQEGMWKIDDKGQAYKWGIRPPKEVQATLEDDGTTTYAYLPAPLTPDIIPCPPDDEGDFGCGLDDESLNTNPYRWVYTYYNSRTGSESNPSDEMSVEVANIKFTKYNDNGTLNRQGQAVKLTGFIKPTDPQVDRLRIYRLGGTLNEYILEQEVPWDTVEFTSFESDVAIAANPILSFGNDVPFTTLVPSDESEDIPGQYLDTEDEFGITAPTSLFETPMGRAWGPFAGSYIFACGDPYRPSVLYWTNAGNPDGANDLNEVQVTSTITPLQNGFVFGGNPYVWTKDDLYALDWSGAFVIPEFTPRETPLGMGLSAPEAFAVGTKGVYFLSKDGIYVTDCQTYAQSITEDSLKPIFLGQPVSVGDPAGGDEIYLNPLNWGEDWLSECYLIVAANELHFLYWDTGQEQDDGSYVEARIHLVYDIQKERWQKFKPANEKYAAYVYGDVNQSKYTVLMALNDGYVYTVDESLEEGDQVSESDYYAEIPFHCEVRTGAGDLGRPLLEKEFGVVQVDVDPVNKVIDLKPLYNAETQTGTPLQINQNGLDSGRQTYSFSLGDHYAKNVTYDFQWDGKAKLYQKTTLARMDEELVVHWEHPETSMDIPGWKHIRDVYLGLRTGGQWIFTVRIDGVDYNYVGTGSTTRLEDSALQMEKVYLPMEPVKGKVYRFFINAISDVIDDPYAFIEAGFDPEAHQYDATPFRLYAEDTYLYVKQWHTGNTYSKFNLGGTDSG
jgi:hypothetical protein